MDMDPRKSATRTASRLLPAAWLCVLAAPFLLLTPTDPAVASPTLERVQDMPGARFGHNSVGAQDGKVYVLLGKNTSGTFMDSVNVYDPDTGKWAQAGSDPVPPPQKRIKATATLLQSGKILIAGGLGSGGDVLAGTLLFDPRAPDGSKWATGPSMAKRRFRHTTTLLKNGKILIVGGAGCDAGTSCTEATAVSLATSQIFDPSSGLFLPDQAMPSGSGRFDHAAALIPDGNDPAAGDVRVFGGLQGSVHPTPASRTIGSGDGAVTHIARKPGSGGNQITVSHFLPPVPLAPLQVEEDVPGKFVLVQLATDASGLPASTSQKVAAAVSAQSMLVTAVAGGTGAGLAAPAPPAFLSGGGPVSLATTLLYTGGAWCGASEGLGPGQARSGHTVALLHSGEVLILGGQNPEGAAAADFVIYDPAPCGSETATAEPSPPGFIGRWSHTASLLPDGELLIAGGEESTPGIPSIQVLDFDVSPVGMTDWVATARTDHAAAVLPSGEVLIVGGRNDDAAGDVTVTELYDPSNGSWCGLAPIGGPGPGTPLKNSSAVLLPGGKVLVSFGDDGSGPTREAHVFDPEAGAPACPDQPAGQWARVADLPVAMGGAAADPLGVPRRGAPAVLLRNGKVLVGGGEGPGGVATPSVRVFDPADMTGGPNGTWNDRAPLTTPRKRHTATLLGGGEVLVAGGVNASGNALETCEVYDPAGNVWTACLNTLGPGRWGHAATLLPDGGVLITGGRDQIGSPASSVTYFDPGSDPFEGTVASRAPMGTARAGHTAVLLPSGRVLVAFGEGSSGALSTSEIYIPSTDTWVATDPLEDGLAPRGEGHRSVLLPNGKVLAIGGITDPAAPDIEVFDPECFEPECDAWTAGTDIALPAGKNDHAAVLLETGQVLIAGGEDEGGTILAAANAYDLGHGASSSRRPVISTAGDPPGEGSAGEDFTVTGERFASFEASGGNSFQHSSAGFPILRFQRIEGGLVYIVPPKPGTWNHTSATSTLPAGMIPGHYRLSVISAGVPSTSKIVRIERPVDADGDGHPRGADCDDTNGQVWTVPTPAWSLSLEREEPAGITTIEWLPPLEPGGNPAAVRYDTVRSQIPGDFTTGAVCVESDDGTDTTSMEVAMPPTGRVYLYWIRAENACGAGDPRTGRPCP